VTKDSLNAPSLNFEDCISSITLGATGFFFRSEVAIVSGKTAIVILAREREKRSRQDHDRGFVAHNRSFATKKNPVAPRVSKLLLYYCEQKQSDRGGLQLYFFPFLSFQRSWK